MADISLIVNECMDDQDEGVFEQADISSAGAVDLESLPPLIRIQNYAKSTNIYDRQMVLRVVLELFRAGPAQEGLLEDLPEILGVVASIAEKDEVVVVRTDLLEQLPVLAARIKECLPKHPELSTVITQYLIPIIVKNMYETESPIRNATHCALFTMVEQGFLTKEETEDHVCPAVIAISKVENVIDIGTSAITLMSRLAPLLGAEITERVFLPKFSELCSKEMFYMRKVCAAHFGDFCAVVTREAFEQILLPCYVELCGDQMWGVRKDCAEVVMSVSCACSPNMRRAILAPVFLKLLQDETRWVRMAAFHSLGPFISTFADPTVTSITYNNVGELVLVNADGNEFKFSSPTSMDGVPRPGGGDFQMIYQSSEKLGSNGLRTFIDPFGYNDREVDIEVNPLCNILDEEPEIKDVVVDIEMPSLEEPTDEKNKEDKEEKIIQKSFTIVSKALFGEIVESVDNSEEEDVQLNGHTDEQEPEEDLKEIVETVKNAVLSYRNGQDDTPVQCNVNVIDTRKENCDNLSSRLGDHNYSIDNGSGDRIMGNGFGDESLEMFNSYNYWRVSPEMPLDPTVVDAGRSPKKNVKMIEGHSIVRRLDELYSKLSLDDTLDETSTNHTTRSPEKQYIEVNNMMQESQQVPKFLIDHYISMTDPSLAQTTDTDMAYHCAYSLPAVALTLGSQNWHLLKNTVESLAADMQYKVRRTVACSLHELALILGPDIATNSLTPLFDGFIKDLDEVRIGVLNNLAHFLELIMPAQRSVYLPKLADFLQTDSEWNWRFRQELARQLLLAVPLFRPCDAAKHLAGIAHELMCDKVAAVRQVALSLTTQIVKHISPERRLTSHVLVKLAEGFAHSKKWKRRQTFALLCSELLIAQAVSHEQFGSDVMPHLLDLSWDPVANVRLVVARTIAKHIIVIDYFREPNNQFLDSLETVLRRLQTDKDRDVRQNAVMDQYTNPLI